MLRLGMLVSTLVLASTVWASSAAAQICDRWNTPGCVQLRIMGVDADATREHVRSFSGSAREKANEAYHYVSGLLDGTFTDSFQTAAAIYNLSTGKGQGEQKREDYIKLVRNCAPHYVYFWRINKGAGVNIRESSVAVGKGGHQPTRVTNAPLVVLNGSEPPDEVFELQLCEGEGGLNIPVAYLTLKSYILICPKTAALFPAPKSRNEWLGHHVNEREIYRWYQQKLEYDAGKRKRPIFFFVTVYGRRPQS